MATPVNNLGEFGDEAHAQLYAQYRHSVPQALVEDVLKRLDQTSERRLAVDVGCGNGQLTFMLAPSFEVVRGFDISPAQVAEAKRVSALKHVPNVSFSVSEAESLPEVEDCSVDLVTVCTALHWFDLERFFAEVNRILKPEGALVVISDYEPEIAGPQTSSADPERLKKISHKFLDGIKSFSNPAIHSYLEEYKNVNFPYSDVFRSDTLYWCVKCPLSTLECFYQTYSGFQRLRERLGPEKAQRFLQEVSDEIKEVVGVSKEVPSEAVLVDLRHSHKYILCRSRK